MVSMRDGRSKLRPYIAENTVPRLLSMGCAQAFCRLLIVDHRRDFELTELSPLRNMLSDGDGISFGKVPPAP